MTDIDTGSFLEHYGVKGMKWGVTRKELLTKGYFGSIQAKHDRVNAERRAAGKSELNSFGFPKKSMSEKTAARVTRGEKNFGKSMSEKTAARVARGERKFGKSKSTAGVVGRVVGRELLREVGMLGANVALSKIPASPQVKSGAQFVMSAANLGLLVRDGQDARAYVKSKR